ncbi:MAG: hypothetical protein ACRC3Y_16735 [Romboutsia sp.]|uniref:hypothetical protein n=1 Tax=Romboutsia sp. TaxID=1965302 RepID=UPI003F34088E
MIVLSRENIIEGLIELREKEENENRLIVSNIKNIIDNKDMNDLEKLKFINTEIAKALLA